MDKNGNENAVSISYKIKLIDSARFMASSLQNLVDNLAIFALTKVSANIVVAFLNIKVSMTI